MESRADGHISSSAYKRYSKRSNPREYFGLLKARIEDISYVGDEDNDSFDLYGFNSVLYGVRVIGSQYDGCHISGVIDVGDLGGQYNYSETIRSFVEDQTLSNGSGDTEPKLGNGDWVLILPMAGDLERTVIIKGFPHPLNERIGPTTEEGRRNRSEFNGIEENIDKEGNYRIRIVGKKSPKGEIINEDGVGSEIILYKNGDIELNAYGTSEDTIPESVNSKDLRIRLNKETKKIELYSQENSVEMSESGIKVKEKGGGALNLAGGKVALGNSDELLQQISDQLDKIITFCGTAKTHTHLGNLGYETAPPTDDSPWSTLSSDCSTIKGKIDGIKGTL